FGYIKLAVALKENTYNQTKETLAIYLVLIIEKQTSQFTNHAAMKTESYQLTYQQMTLQFSYIDIG
uniref:Uncharacterized protein n=1 Tax=Glossina palpalis gambiensis TaxID=67801 RepID=A0A1B0C190_9MUSC